MIESGELPKSSSAREVYSRVREDLVTESGDDRDIRPLDI